MARRDKESAMKALAKRPKLFDAIATGKHNIHILKKLGECSGGLIRSLIWSDIAEFNDDKTIKFKKGIKKSDLPDVDATPIKEKRAAKQEMKKAKKESPAKKGVQSKKKVEPVKPDKKSQVKEKPVKEEKQKPVKEEKQKPVKESKAEKQKEMKPKVLETKTVKLIKPVGDIPANHPVKAERMDDGFWWVKGKRIATTNLK